MYLQTKTWKFKKISNTLFFKNYKKGCFTIVFDFDGVFTSPQEIKARLINKLGYKIRPHETEAEYCIKFKKVKEENYKKATIDAYTKFLMRTPLAKGVDPYFYKVKKLSIKLYVLSSRSDDMIMWLEPYLKKYRLIFGGIFNTNDGPKRKLLALLRPDVFVEDSPYKLRDVFEDQGCKKVNTKLKQCKFILLRNVANKHSKVKGKIQVIPSWKYLYELIKKEKNVRRKTVH